MNQTISIFSSPTSDYLDNKDQKNSIIEEIIRNYGFDSLSYLSLEGEKQYFIANDASGFIAYVVILNIAVCIGNPICTNPSTLTIVNEFKIFCKYHKLKLCFCSVSEDLALLLKNNGFVISKYGEEALLDLDTYNLSGGKVEKLRQKLRRAEKLGIVTYEYFPTLKRDYKLEEKIENVTKDWFSQKNGEMTFSLGDLNFDNPMGRRFFVSLDKDGEVNAILMFSPFDNQNGYFLDVMRRKSDSCPGVMEKAIIDAAMKMKSEGRKWISLGLAPLSGIDISKSEANSLEKIFNFVYNHANSSYNFQSLYQYKKKFNPSCWHSRYVVYEIGLSTIKVAYVMAKARNIRNILGQVIISMIKFGAQQHTLFSKPIKTYTTKLFDNASVLVKAHLRSE